MDDLVNRADQALYQSKRDGRNRTPPAEPVAGQPDQPDVGQMNNRG